MEEEKECSTFLNDTFNCFSGPVSEQQLRPLLLFNTCLPIHRSSCGSVCAYIEPPATEPRIN